MMMYWPVIRDLIEINIDNSHTACYPNEAVVQGALYDVRAVLERGAAKNTDPILWGRGEK